MRIDKKLVEDGFFETRTKAQEAISKGFVMVDGKVITQASFDASLGKITVMKDAIRYVSRGGYKLEKAILAFNLDFQDKIVVDIGASTGGFTDCAIKHGAKLVYAIDVGTMQLDTKLRQDNRVISLENTNFLDVSDEFNNDYFVMDVSFISITKLLPKIKEMLKGRVLVTLIKPQFEAGRINFKNGVLHDRKKHEVILKEILEFSSSIGLVLRGITFSPIKGKSGNIEYLAYFKDEGKALSVDIKRLVCDAFNGVMEC